LDFTSIEEARGNGKLGMTPRGRVLPINFFNTLQIRLFIRRDQRESVADASALPVRPMRMDIVFGVKRNVKIDDVADVLDVDSRARAMSVATRI